MRQIQFTGRAVDIPVRHSQVQFVDKIVDIPVVAHLVTRKIQSRATQLMKADVLLLNSRHTTFLMHEGTKVKAAFAKDGTLTRCAHGAHTGPHGKSELCGRKADWTSEHCHRVEHTTNPEFKCIPHVIKHSIHFDANRWTCTDWQNS